MQVTIMIGAQGSGKSTWAKANRPRAVLCSADQFFVQAGKYRFDPRQLGDAHGFCFRTAIESVRKGNDIVVDNTNASIAEIAPYHALAQAYSARLEIVWVHCDPHVAAARCTHGVPHDAVVATQERIDQLMLPVFWQRTEIHVGDRVNTGERR